MVNRRLIPAFLIALSVAALCTWALAKRLAHPVAVAAAMQPMAHVAAATRPMNVGDTLRPEVLQLVEWPANAALAGSFARVQDLVGRVLLVPVAAGQPILMPYLAAPGTGTGLMAKIPAGMRAVSVHADEIAGVAGFVAPDSFVDVLVTTRGSGDLVGSTVCILQDVRVLAVGQKTESEASVKPVGATADAITLLLSAADGPRLAQASSQGKILLLLRNGADRGVVPVAPVEAVKAAPAANGSTHAAHALVPHAEAYTVETVTGGKQSSESFEGKNK